MAENKKESKNNTTLNKVSMQRKCLVCAKPIEGRKDKIYCDVYCKSSHQYKKIQAGQLSTHHKINLQLRLNKKILKRMNQAGKATIRESDLLSYGFNPRIITHYWRNKEGKTYLFVYEYGFMKIYQNYKTKYALIKWQDYMNKQIFKSSKND